jgi:hypothetical protein
MSAIAGAASSLKTASEIVQAMIGLRDASVFQTKAIELQRQILAAQASALAAHSDQFALLQRIRELEEEVARVKAWEAEKQRYELQKMPPGVFVRVLKAEMTSGEPMHCICQTCYERGKKGVLNSTEPHNGQYDLMCNECGSKLTVGKFKAEPWDNGGGSPGGPWA